MPETFPTALQMREIKYSPKHTDADRAATAKRLEAAGRLAEALDLYLLAKHESGIQGLRALAVREGRPILLLMLARVGGAVTPEEWKRTGDAAFAAGRWREALRAFTEANDEASLARVKEKIPESASFPPQGK